MNAVENTPTITRTQALGWTCSAVWGGKLWSVSETFQASPVIWRSSAVWGSRTLWMYTIFHPCAPLCMAAVTGPLSSNPGSMCARGVN